MYYYEVLVASSKFHGDSTLTYGYGSPLKVGSVVVVPLQRQTAVAVVVKEVVQPGFKTKEILRSISLTPLPPQLHQLVLWLKDYYPAPSGQIMSLLLPSNLAQQSREIGAENNERIKPQALPNLTEEQVRAIQAIHEARSKHVLLHGNTGTGKTRVYIELAKETLAHGKSAILLTPEIGLTPQLAIAVNATFPGQTIVVHSELTQAKRRKTWLRILESHEPLIIVGARSALFSPMKNIGLIVIDEFHETSYKQEQSPHYLTPIAAAKLARLHDATLLLGSATPPVTDYYAFQQKKLPIIRMKERAVKSNVSKPNISIIDLKKRELFRTSRWLSDPLINAVETAMDNQQQSLIFLNRRGTARLVLCQVCGWQSICPRCDLSLTYHSDTHNMQCHTCGFSQKTPTSCPECSSNDIIFRAIGTKSLVAELERLFPNASIKRFDSDTVRAERLENQYKTIREGRVDILVGTQMLGKGLDLPKLSVLGIALADTSLSFPDYTAEERTFQLLTQVIGRVNRGHISGSVYIQTYQPDNPLLDAALCRDYERFFNLQLAERKQYGFPPFRFTLKLICSRAKRTTAERAAHALAKDLRARSQPTEVIGPSPSFVEKVHDRYRWQIIVKSAKRDELVQIIKSLPANWSYDIDPINLL